MAGPAGADRRREILRLLNAAGPGTLGIIAMADALDVHPNTVRFHLSALLRDGLIEQVTSGRRQRGRPALEFRAIPQMNRRGPQQYRLLAEILITGLADSPRPQQAATSAGRAWGRRLQTARSSEPVDGLVDVLDELGFAPDPPTNDGRIRLRHCAFLELAERHSDVVCPIHLGLMQGALEQWDAPTTVERLEPFVEPGLCVAHLTQQGGTP